jgi:DnaJ-class molecular chaperone
MEGMRMSGTLTYWVDDEVECPECEGHGEVEYERTTGGVSNDTPYIDITCTLETCEMCGGWGKVEE